MAGRCQAVHNKEASSYKPPTFMDTIHPPQSHYGETQLHMPETSKILSCIKITFHQFEKDKPHHFYRQIAKAMTTLSLHSTDRHIYWLVNDVDPKPHVFLLIQSESSVSEQEDPEYLFNIEHSRVEFCYNGYQQQFDTSLLGDQISVYGSKGDLSPMTDRYSDCVLAYFHSSNKCSDCLKRKFGTASQTSKITHLVMIDDNHFTEKSTISDCITESIGKNVCRSVFVHSERNM